MSSVPADPELQMFIGYFEEPEPGVPGGCTGWYHSGGRFALSSPEKVFISGSDAPSLIRAEVAGPFTSRTEALADMELYFR